MHLHNIYLTALASFSIIFSPSFAMDLAYMECAKITTDVSTSNQVQIDAENALLEAAKTGNVIGCCFLLESGVSANIKDAKGQTPLMLAARNSHIAVCKLLIQYGALIGSTDSEGHSALSLATTTEIIKVLKEQPRKLSGTESPPD